MADKIRLGIIGASPTVGWAHRSHLPAIAASPEYELTGVCTTRMETAEESQRQYGARLAFDSYQEMLAHPDIDAVAVVLRVPAHYEITKDALNAGKHVFTEWPLGRTTGEAEELADLARSKGVTAVVGLQARAAPAVLQMKQLVEQGYVGEIMSCSMTLIRGGVLARPSGRTWQRDVDLGANTLTIATGHSIDAMRFVAGDFAEVSAVVSTQCEQWYETDTDQYLDVTSPDNILINGRLSDGGVVSAHVASIPWAGSGYRLEVYGREGTLIADSEDSPQLGPVRLQGARGVATSWRNCPSLASTTSFLKECPRARRTTWGNSITFSVRQSVGKASASPISIPLWTCIAWWTPSASRRRKSVQFRYNRAVALSDPGKPERPEGPVP